MLEPDECPRAGASSPNFNCSDLMPPRAGSDVEYAREIQRGSSEFKGKKLFNAIRIGDVTTAKAILDSDKSLSTMAFEQNVTKSTALHWACLKGRSDIARMLIDSCASVSEIDRSGRTPLHCAAAKGHAECVRLLLQCGADTSATDFLGNVAEDWSKRKEHTEAQKEFGLHRMVQSLISDHSQWNLANLKNVLEMSGRKTRAIGGVSEAERAVRTRFAPLSTVWKEILFRTRVLCKRAFSVWRLEVNQTQSDEQRVNYVAAIRSHAALTSVFSEWKVVSRELRAWHRGFEASSEIQAATLPKRTLRDAATAFRSLRVWAECTRQVIVLRRLGAMLYSRRTDGGLARAFAALAAGVTRAKAQVARWMAAGAHARRRYAVKAMAAWRSTAIRQAVFSTTLHMLRVRRDTAVKRSAARALGRWRRAVFERAAQADARLVAALTRRACARLAASCWGGWATSSGQRRRWQHVLAEAERQRARRVFADLSAAVRYCRCDEMPVARGRDGDNLPSVLFLSPPYPLSPHPLSLLSHFSFSLTYLLSLLVG